MSRMLPIDPIALVIVVLAVWAIVSIARVCCMLLREKRWQWTLTDWFLATLIIGITLMLFSRR